MSSRTRLLPFISPSASYATPKTLDKSTFSNDRHVLPNAAPLKSHFFGQIIRGLPSSLQRSRRRVLATLIFLTLAFFLACGCLRENDGLHFGTFAWSSKALRATSSLTKEGMTGRLPDGRVRVDRSVLDKLRLLDQHFALDDEDEIEARHADRLPHHQLPNAPPPLLNLPDTKRRQQKQVIPEQQAVLEEYTRDQVEHLADIIPASAASFAAGVTCPGQTAPGGQCKFLVAAWIGEQETKAQMHLYQLGLLALSLNRTLVLPNVAKSRMSTCGSHPFNFYYEADSLSRLGIPSVTYSEFAAWTKAHSQDTLPSAQVVSVANSMPDAKPGQAWIGRELAAEAVPNAPNRKLCLTRPRAALDFAAYSPVAFSPDTEAWHKTNEDRLAFGQTIITHLASRSMSSDSYRLWDSEKRKKDPDPVSLPDVLVVNYELRYPILDAASIPLAGSTRQSTSVQAFAHFPYASIWSQVASELADKLSPFIAVHWRQETLDPSTIKPCATALVDELARILDQQYPNIKTVYLATDYPIEDAMQGKEGIAAHSGTFGKLITEEHHEAMHAFLMDFKRRLTRARGVRLTTFATEHASIPWKVEEELLQKGSSMNLAELDAGLLGIIDKEVALKADVFMTGQPLTGRAVQETACAKESSFTRQISMGRRATLHGDATTGTRLLSK